MLGPCAKFLFCVLFIENVFILLINLKYFFINFFIYGKEGVLYDRSPRTPLKTPDAYVDKGEDKLIIFVCGTNKIINTKIKEKTHNQYRVMTFGDNYNSRKNTDS